jgi:hypothetical protein
MKTVILLFPLLLTAQYVSARLEETEQEIATRYDEPKTILPDDGAVKTRVYSSGGFTIIVRFETGISTAETVMKSDGSVKP